MTQLAEIPVKEEDNEGFWEVVDFVLSQLSIEFSSQYSAASKEREQKYDDEKETKKKKIWPSPRA